MSTIGVVTGMAFEAEWLQAALRKHPEIAVPGIDVAGASLARAEAGATRLIENGAWALLSFGIAGGLNPALKPGDLVVADAIVSAGGPALETDADWRGTVLDALNSLAAVRVMPILSVEKAVQDVSEKARLFRETKAGAVDMESYGVAKAAAEAGIPMLAVRAIADTADRRIPHLGQGTIGPDGQIRLGPLLGALMRRPGEIGRLIGVARDTGKARRTLRRVAARDLGVLLRA